MRYVPGLDGVRAIAVGAVLLYHARVSWLPGGFLGVDVFFVLSGYLITSLLLAERRRSGRVVLARFWAGRARRLLPAAVVVIGVCVFVDTLYLQTDLHRLRSDALASLFYVNNWHQILVSHSYFDAFARPSLLQHFWSLSVEEQFYLVWPIVLVGGLAIGGRRWVLGFAFATAGLSAAMMAALYHQGLDPSRVYYGTDTRAGPLMIGAIMAFGWPLGRLTRHVGPGVPTLANGVGFAALGTLALLMHSWHDHDAVVYRGGLVIAAGAAAMLIAVAVHPASSLSRLLGTRSLRWLGQRSYGIYLWHWPVMALTRPGIDVHWSSTFVIPMQIATTLVLASLSYRYVEMPVRRGQAQRRLRVWWDRSPFDHRLITGTALAGIISAAVVSTVLLPSSSGSARMSLRTAVAGPSSPQAAQGGYITGQDPAAAPIRASSGRVLAVGSSVMLAAKSTLLRQLHARVDAVAGRSSAAIIGRLEAYQNARRLPATVIVQIGDETPISSAMMARVEAVLHGVPHVVLVNIPRTGVSWESDVTRTLERGVRHWPAAIVARSRSTSAHRTLTADSVYQSRAGQAAYAALISRALTALAARSSGYGVQATVISDSVGETMAETPQAMLTLNRRLRLRLNLMVCRRLSVRSCTYGGVTPPPALQVIKSLGLRLGRVLVIDVGYNDDSDRYRSGIDQVMRAALKQGARVVVWVTLRQFGNNASTYQANNAAIRHAARRWPQLRVADWNRYSAGKPWFADDVHPNADGALALATFLHYYITTAVPVR